MAKKIDLTNQKFGRLTVVRDSKERAKYGHIIWLCKCTCGRRVKIISGNLRYGHTRSCGCLSKERIKAQGKVSVKHGENDKSRLYIAWVNLKRKCYNPNAVNFKNYGGKKIKVCKEWRNRKTGYISFRAWVLNNGYSASFRNFIVDRIDRRKNYSPSNCQLISRSNLMRKIWEDRRR